jgi:predicted flap endonuclease-1-like 5' DNA nuclease
MWDQTFKRWIDLVFWWLPKSEPEQATPPPTPQAAKPAPEPAEPAAASAPKQAPPPAATAKAEEPAAGRAKDATPDDLTVIKGIGPAVQKKLQALGIRTFHDLASADPATLTEQLKGRQPVSQALVRGWTEAADRQSTARH